MHWVSVYSLHPFSSKFSSVLKFWFSQVLAVIGPITLFEGKLVTIYYYVNLPSEGFHLHSRDTEQHNQVPRSNLVNIIFFTSAYQLNQSPNFTEATSYFAYLTRYSPLLSPVSLTSFGLCPLATKTHLSPSLLCWPVLYILLQPGPTHLLEQGPMHCYLVRETPLSSILPGPLAEGGELGNTKSLSHWIITTLEKFTNVGSSPQPFLWDCRHCHAETYRLRND